MKLPFRKLTLSNRKSGEYRGKTKNVVIFGETGVGKSSLVNLIAGENIAETSSNAIGCTLSYRRYPLQLGDQPFVLWDTAGLGEGTKGTVPAEKAEAYLKRLLRDLAEANGVDLLIYCVRGTRIRSALLTNYHLFYSMICRKKVPIAIVITGLKNQGSDMDTWWLKNERQFSALRMHFNNHACVTTLQSPMQDPALEERRRISRAAVTKMIVDTCRTEQWKPAERSWVSTAFPDTRAIMSSRGANRVRVANVVMCDVSRSNPVNPDAKKRAITFQNPVILFRSFGRPISFRSPVSVVENPQSKLPFSVTVKCTPERLLRVHHVPKKRSTPGYEEEETKDMVVKRGADLLIFCVEKRPGECGLVRLQWEHFKVSYGGDLSPQIIVVVGAVDQQSAEEWWNDAVLGGAITRPRDASIAYWPTNKSFIEVEAARGRLRNLINTCCIDCSKENFSDEQIFRCGTSPGLDRNPRVRPPRNSRGDEHGVARQDVDVLTRWGVWEHISTERNAVGRQDTTPPRPGR